MKTIGLSAPNPTQEYFYQNISRCYGNRVGDPVPASSIQNISQCYGNQVGDPVPTSSIQNISRCYDNRVGDPVPTSSIQNISQCYDNRVGDPVLIPSVHIYRFRFVRQSPAFHLFPPSPPWVLEKTNHLSLICTRQVPSALGKCLSHSGSANPSHRSHLAGATLHLRHVGALGGTSGATISPLPPRCGITYAYLALRGHRPSWGGSETLIGDRLITPCRCRRRSF